MLKDAGATPRKGDQFIANVRAELHRPSVMDGYQEGQTEAAQHQGG